MLHNDQEKLDLLQVYFFSSSVSSEEMILPKEMRRRKNLKRGETGGREERSEEEETPLFYSGYCVSILSAIHGGAQWELDDNVSISVVNGTMYLMFILSV